MDRGWAGHGELIRSTGQVGPTSTLPWIPVPGCAAGAPQAANSSPIAPDTISRFIQSLHAYDADAGKRFPASGAAHTGDRVSRGVDRALRSLVGARRAVARIDDHRRAERRPGEQRPNGGQRQVDATVAGEWAILGPRA